jgi:hypothetical protein
MPIKAASLRSEPALPVSTPSRVLWSGGEGKILLVRPAPAVMLFVYEGVIGAEAVASIANAVDREIALTGGRRPDQFLDLEAMTSYASDFRVQLAQWGGVNKHRLGQLHVLFNPSSRLVAMAVSVVNLALGGAFNFASSRRAFEEALARAKLASPATT